MHVPKLISNSKESQMFFELLLTSFAGILKVFFIGILGAAVLGGIRIKQSFLDALSTLFVRITLPCLIFTNMVKQFRPEEVDRWWVFPLLGIGLFLAGGLLAYGYLFIDTTVKYKGIFTSSVAFHNSIILPLAIAPVLFSPGRLERFLSLLFLYNLLAVPAFFTVGVWLVNASSGMKRSLAHVINPPNIATIGGLLFACCGLHMYLPNWLMNPLEMFGSLTTPLSMIIVGGIILVSIPNARGKEWAEPVKIMFLKSILLPGIVCLFVCTFKPPEYIGLFLILGSAMPVGSTLAVICPSQKSMQKMVAGGILLSSIASIVAMPVFIGVYGMVYQW